MGAYCVIGYFDAFDISEEKKVKLTDFNTWDYLGKLTSQLDGTVNCRMLVCVTEHQEEDKRFWENQSDDSLFFITMVRVSSKMKSDKMNDIIRKLAKTQKCIGYFSYDYSEIIVVTKTNKYSDGIKAVKKLRKILGAVKTYTVFAVMEKFLESYESIQKIIVNEKICCRLHCMVKDYKEAEKFKLELEQHMSNRNGRKIKIHKFETFGEYDWLMEINSISICSMFECYKMKNLLTHSNNIYNKAFFNIESEILVEEGEENDSYLD